MTCSGIFRMIMIRGQETLEENSPPPSMKPTICATADAVQRCRPVSRRGFFKPVDKEEEYATAFAMALLMPEEDVRDQHRSGMGWAGMILRYDVPAEYVIRRLEDLGLEVRV